MEPIRSVQFRAFAAERNRLFSLSFWANYNWNKHIVSDKHFHTREAVVALLKMAKTTSNPELAAGLVQAAADLKDQVGELPPPISKNTLRNSGHGPDT